MTMKLPGPDHPITLTYNPMRVHVLHQGHQIADSVDVLILREADYPPVYYFPREDVAMDYLAKTDHRTHCPYKGEASYFTLARDGEIDENAVWSYETPYPAMALIRDRVAFYPHYVTMDVHDLGGEEAVREAIEHTDAGAGRSQAEHWPQNVEPPLNSPFREKVR